MNRFQHQGRAYDFRAEDVVNNRDVQVLMADHVDYSVAQGYLRSRPMFDVMAMWWHTAYFPTNPTWRSRSVLSTSIWIAQVAEILIYLTDVEANMDRTCLLRDRINQVGTV